MLDAGYEPPAGTGGPLRYTGWRASESAADSEESAAFYTRLEMPPLSMRHWTTIASQIALATAIASCGRSERRAVAEQELLTAISSWRPTEGRLADVGEYRPCGPIDETDGLESLICPRGSSPEEELRRVTEGLAGILRNAETPMEVTLRARALARLVSYLQGHERDLQTSIDDLERATELAPDHHRTWNELAIIHLALAAEFGAPRHLLFALESSLRAARLDPWAAAPRFNVALALERLALRSQAVEALREVLRRDRGSGWAREAMLRLAAERRRASPLPTPELIARRALDTDADPDGLARLAFEQPQASREAAFEHLLVDWAEASLARSPKAGAILKRMTPLAEALAERTGDRSLQATLQHLRTARGKGAVRNLALGHLAYGEGRRSLASMADQRAGRAFDQAASRFERGASPFLPWALLGVAACDLRAGRYGPAIETSDRIARRFLDFPILAGLSLWTSGLARGKRGSFGQALDHFTAALARLEATGETRNVTFLLTLVAEMHRFLGNDADEWQARHRALLLSRPASSRQLHILMWDAGLSLRHAGRLELALTYQNEGLRLADASGDPHMRAEARLWRSSIHLDLGNESAALADLDAAEAARRELEDEGMRQRFGSHLAVARAAALRRSDPAAALELLRRAVLDYRSGQVPLRLTEALLEQARNHSANGRAAAAVADLAEAIEIFESQRSSLATVTDRLSLARTRRRLYDLMIDLQAVELGRPAAALAYSERGRALLTSAVPPETILLDGDLSRRMPPDALILEYAVLPDRLLVWALSAGGLHQSSIEVSARRLEAMVRDARKAAAAGRSADEADELARWLLPAGLLRGRSRILLVPDGALHGLPFGALPAGPEGRPLVRSAELTISPSILLALRPKRRREAVPPRSIVLFGNPRHDRERLHLPPLPEAGAEVREVARLYPSAAVFSGAAATRARFLEHLDRYQVLHFAGHAVAGRRPDDPAYLVLAADTPVDSGAFYLDEMAVRRFEHLELVILSACGTVAGDGSRTGGFAGLARPFLAAGVPRVVGTLWPIGDRAARQLLVRFHRALGKHGEPGRALREAQLQLIGSDDPDLSSPSAWAAFQVVGAFDLETVPTPQGGT